jgi:CheY-like chemotaxis protein
MPPTLLVLDNNTTVQRMTKLTFRAEGVRVNAVQPGSDGFEEIEAHPPDIIFTDHAAKVVAFLKSRPNLSRIPVVLLKGAFDASASADDELADDVLMKPLQPDAMIECVKRLLKSPDAASSNQEQPSADGVDSRLDLDRYFDELSLAFNKAQSTQFQLEGDLWRWSDASNRNPPAAMSPAIEHERRDRTSSAMPVVDKDLVEQVTQRVLDRLGERIVRSTATEIVSRLSKWLIVNEVERSKAGQ